MRPDAKYHDEPCSMPFQGQKNCTMCPQTTRWMCWGCNLELGEVFPVCSPSTGRNCFAEMHKLRTDIWDWIFYDTDTKNEYVHTLNMKNIMRLIECKYIKNFICWMKKRFIASTPPCPPYPARHKGRNDKSIMKVNFIYLCEFLNYLSFVGDA